MLDIARIHEAIDRFILTHPSEEYHVKIHKDDRQRPYLGLSGLGHECLNYLFLQWRHCFKPTFPSRMHRLFRRGDLEEYRYVWMLKGIGVTVHERDSDGKQFFVEDFSGHVKGNLDSVLEFPLEFWLEGFDPEALLGEYKTANSKKFEEFKKLGVKEANSKYYGQIQSYCGYMELAGCLFCVVCKDTDELYFEFVPALKREFKRLVSKAETVVTATGPLPKLSTIPSFWKCKFCDGWDQCHGGKPSIKHCRSCRWASPAENKSWICEKNHTYGTVCKDYRDIAKQ